MKKGALLFLLVAVFLVMMSVKIRAEEAERDRITETPEHRHGVELFLGNTHEDGENGFSIGFTYEYRLNELFGIGGLIEYAGKDFREWVLAAPFFLHPYEGWRFLVAPGIDIEDEDGDNNFLLRAGAAYEFEITERWSITPEFNVDFVDGDEVFVYGFSFGYGF
ncbi:MAG: hypothetical protein JRK53_27755 [Deltaproteobacteria bacterium]|nr:hypothetical protein [Deltaproteobacteria bacterium]